MRWYVVSWNVGVQPEKGVMLRLDLQRLVTRLYLDGLILGAL